MVGLGLAPAAFISSAVDRASNGVLLAGMVKSASRETMGGVAVSACAWQAVHCEFIVLVAG
jgi:hypothetical protein